MGSTFGGGFFKFAVKRAFKTRPNSPYGGETSSYYLLQQGVTNTKPTEEEIAKKTEREDFFRQLMTKKKPLLQRQKSNPTPVDITKEESIAKYIAAENDEDDLSSKE